MAYAFPSSLSIRGQKTTVLLIVAIMIVIAITIINRTKSDQNQRPVHTRQLSFSTKKDYLAYVAGYVKRDGFTPKGYLLEYRFIREISEQDRREEEREIERRSTGIAGNPHKALYVLEVRDIKDRILMSEPLGLIAPGEPKIGVSYQQQNGIFYQPLIIPQDSSYVILVERQSSKIMHISYLEYWTPL